MDHTNHVRLTAAEINSATLAGVTVYGLDDANLGASQLDLMRDEDGEVHAVTAFTEDQLKQMPEHHEPDGGTPWPAS